MEENYPNLKIKNQEQEFNDIFDSYGVLLRIFAWTRIVIVGTIVLIGIYNLFIAGKRYSLSEYNLIKNIMVTIFGVILLVLLIILVLVFKRLGSIRGRVKKIATDSGYAYKDLKKEINLIIKSNLGSPGI